MSTYLNLLGTVKAVLIEKFTSVSAYINKKLKQKYKISKLARLDNLRSKKARAILVQK